MARFGDVLGVEQRQELGIAQEIIPGELNEALDRLRRIEVFKIEPALLHPDLLISAFEHGEIEFVLLADVIVQHALVGTGLGRDAVDPRPGKAVGGKLLLRRFENTKPHPLWIALPLLVSPRLGQSKSRLVETL